MNIRTKITVVTGTLILVSLFLALGQYFLERERASLLLDSIKVEEQKSFNRLLALSESRLALFASDYTCWDEMVDYVHHPDPVFAQENIDVSIPTFAASEVYVYNANGALLYSKDIARPAVPPAFMEKRFDQLLKSRFAHFFAEKNGILTEFRIATIHPTNDCGRLTQPQGLFVVAKHWDKTYLATLAELSGTAVIPSGEQAPDLDVADISFPYEVKDWDGKVVETFTVISPLPIVNSLEQASKRQLWILFGSYVALLFLVYIFLYILVGRPIEALSRGIEKKDIRLMKKMQKGRSEFSILAKLVLDFAEYEQKESFERSKRDFIFLVSHELRTPLTGLRWSVEQFESAKKSSADILATTVSYMTSAIERITTLISSIVDVSKIETGSVITASAPVRITSLVARCVESLKPTLEAKKLTVTVRDATDGNDTVQSDERLLSIIVSNVLSNAVRYSDERGDIRVTIQNEKQELILAIANTGPGIPTAEQPKVFTKLFRATNAKLLSPDGVGLGLYISKSFLGELGGSISFTSTPEKETIFTIRLPFDANENTDTQ